MRHAPRGTALDIAFSTGTPLSFASREVLRFITAQGLASGWTWTFATRAHVWSPSLFQLFGLGPDETPGYDLLLSLVHPDDRPALETPFDIVERGLLRDHTFRIIRPDGTLRILSSWGEVFFDPDGRPRSASAVLLDVTDRQVLARAEREDRQRRWALFEQARTWTNTAAHTASSRAASEELLALTGLTQAEFQSDCLQAIVPEDRRRVAETVRGMMQRGTAFSVTKRLVLAEGGSGVFRFVYAPMRSEDGRIQGWATVASHLDQVAAEPDGALRRALEQGVRGEHLRAARALLGWSMTDLAKASHLSLSTIRRLEEDVEGPAPRNLHCVVRTLRQAGIAFLVLGSGSLAVARF